MKNKVHAAIKSVIIHDSLFMALCALFIGWSMGGTSCYSFRHERVADIPPKTCGFTLPPIPESITEPSRRADYLAAHYWDHFDFTDTACIRLPHITEQAFVDYADILPYVSAAEVTLSIQRLLRQAEKETSGRMYACFLELCDKYLYDPNSPVRDEEYYLPVVRYVLADRRSGEAEKIRMNYTLEQILKNRRGETAADFGYVLPDGKTGRLHGIRAACTILMFYNPGCHACGQTIAALKASPLITRLHADGTVAILLFYPDEDMAAWKQHLADIPAGWLNGYDPQTRVEKEGIYDLRAIPTLYLLDRDKKVLLKDVNFDKIEMWLEKEFR
ncbi:MAG: DUF5106 domain-containing protein [Tannerella sp.]|jgi:hypothetical protein|nr:DUF5106 domain-containing protein [Tannerella sp.]